jgi:hypothetical protein
VAAAPTTWLEIAQAIGTLITTVLIPAIIYVLREIRMLREKDVPAMLNQQTEQINRAGDERHRKISVEMAAAIDPTRSAPR